jgi:hypothetical protein
MTLMSGAMLAFAEQKITFDVISTTGVGGLIGMLYLAPKGKSPEAALRDLPNLFVSDWLYKLVPINFKIFHKYSSVAPPFTSGASRCRNSTSAETIRARPSAFSTTGWSYGRPSSLRRAINSPAGGS